MVLTLFEDARDETIAAITAKVRPFIPSGKRFGSEGSTLLLSS